MGRHPLYLGEESRESLGGNQSKTRILEKGSFVYFGSFANHHQVMRLINSLSWHVSSKISTADPQICGHDSGLPARYYSRHPTQMSSHPAVHYDGRFC